jgi:hypothetical protein
MQRWKYTRGSEYRDGSRCTLREHRNVAVIVLDCVLVGDLKEHMQQEMDSGSVDLKPLAYLL